MSNLRLKIENLNSDLDKIVVNEVNTDTCHCLTLLKMMQRDTEEIKKGVDWLKKVNYQLRKQLKEYKVK